MPADDFPTRRAFVEHCVERLQRSLQGIGPEYGTIHEDLPHNLFPSGSLFPSPEGTIVNELEEEFGQTSYLPSALGFVVRSERKEELTFDISAEFSLYYPVFPSHAEVVQFVDKYGQGSTVKMPPKYKRIRAGIPSTSVSIPLLDTDGFQILCPASAALRTSLESARALATADPNLYGVGRGERRMGRAKTYRRDQLTDAGAWGGLIRMATRKAEPHWAGEILYRVRKDGQGWLVELMLCNTTPQLDTPWVLEEAFIGSQLRIAASVEAISPILLKEVESRDYRHSPWTWASGRNADTKVVVGERTIEVKTESVPLYVQLRARQQAWNRSDGSPIEPSFEALSSDHAIEVLLDLVGAMKEYFGQWNDKALSAPGAGTSKDRVGEAMSAFEVEVRRFEVGVDILRNAANADLLSAFRLTNEAFLKRFTHLERMAATRSSVSPSASGHKPGWRLFQIVFLVSEIGDLLHRDSLRGGDDEPTPTVLWFPTGAGKTEAYLGLVVFHAFWDRLRGKPYGVTALAKFPLRLLSLQQFSRVVGVMEHAEDVRRTSPLLEGRRGDPFSVGYYAGAGNTWNFLDFPVSPDRSSKPSNWTKRFSSILSDPSRLERECDRHRKVPYCPSCFDKFGNPGRVKTTFDSGKPGFSHQCTNCGRVLQLHVTDTEVLRWLPTFVIATIDKLARFAIEPWGRTIFGEAKARCPSHGYLIQRPTDESGSPAMQCPVLGCGGPLSDSPPNVDPVPTLLIQDELHLLTETLGAFASHYETAFVEVLRKKAREGVGRGAWKIVGSTATIEGYRQLVLHLYNRMGAIRFPSPGPNSRESFYVATTEEPQRYIVGVRPHGLSHVDTVMKVLLEVHRQTVPMADLSACAPGTLLPPPLNGIVDEDRIALGRRYRTVLTYGINRNEVQQVNRSYVGQLNPHMRREGLPEFQAERVLDLTGDSAIYKVQDFLEAMESGRDENYFQGVTATSIIGHGVDLDNLNTIIFRGMPHTIAEYIQAMSRVGRKEGVPALVVNVYNPNRERDSSHFEAHCKYLEFRELLLRNIPTTRFSCQALERTVPGLVLHYVNYESPLLNLWQKTDVPGLEREVSGHLAQVTEAVRRRLGIPDSPSPDASLVRRQDMEVTRLVANVRTELIRTPAGGPSREHASDRLRPLKSLRDTDVTVRIFSEVEPSDAGGP